jgi:electron transfer flavoprotein alpha/beta subunit
VKIVVLVRRLRSAPGTPATAVFGACEQAALAAGAALRSARPGSQLAAVAVGPEADNEALVAAAAIGARTYRLWDPALDGCDYDAYARAIAATCKLVGYDLVLCGERSADEGLGVIGPAAAEHLGIPHVTGAIDLGWHRTGRLIVRRREGSRVRTLGAVPPLLVTVGVGFRAAPLSTWSGSMYPMEVLELKRVGLMPQELTHRRQYAGADQSCACSPVETATDPAALAKRLKSAGLI